MRDLFVLGSLALGLAVTAAEPEGACTIDAKPGAAPCSSAAASFESLGLKQGDILMSVNGRKLARPSDAKTAFEKISTNDVKSVEVLRDGHRKKIDVGKKK